MYLHHHGNSNEQKKLSLPQSITDIFMRGTLAVKKPIKISITGFVKLIPPPHNTQVINP